MSREKLNELIEDARNWWKIATIEEKEEMLRKQRESWLRSELQWPKAKFKWANGAKVYDSYEDYIND